MEASNNIFPLKQVWILLKFKVQIVFIEKKTRNPKLIQKISIDLKVSQKKKVT